MGWAGKCVSDGLEIAINVIQKNVDDLFVALGGNFHMLYHLLIRYAPKAAGVLCQLAKSLQINPQ